MPVAELDAGNRPAAVALLRRFRETSLFLLGNLHEYGPRLTDHINSGTFKCVVDGGEVRAVFVLTRRGNLLVQTDRSADYRAPILDACAGEAVPIQGFVGDWALVEPLSLEHARRKPDFRRSYASRETLFRLALPATSGAAAADGRVRTLVAADFGIWDPLNTAYLQEEGIPVQGDPEQRRRTFVEKAERGYWWGRFEAGELVSMGALNTRFEDIGQVGGVYTSPAFRRRGCSRSVMNRLILDSAAVHGLSTLILFTGVTNRSAESLYRALGFREIGEFGLIFGAND